MLSEKEVKEDDERSS